MSIELVTLLLFVSLFLFMVLGLPLAFSLGGVGIIFSYLLWGPNTLVMVTYQTWGAMNSFVLVAIPLFIFMALLLEQAGVAGRLYHMMHLWFGALRGGLAIGTVIICAIFAAMAGNSAAGTVSVGRIAIPEMLERRYDKELAIGAVTCAGGWGVLIPPSIIMIIYALVAEESVGRLFAAGILPGLLLLVLFSLYIVIRCFFQKHLGPAILESEKGTLKEKFQSLGAVCLPIMVILMVLGSIIGGITTPTEAAAMGVCGALISCAFYRKLSWDLLKTAAFQTFKLSGMIIWIVFAAHLFTAVYNGLGAADLIIDLMGYLPGGRWGAIIFIQIVLLLLAMVLDPAGIIFITVPIFVPLIKALGFDPLWFGILFVIQMEIGYQTPPFGFNLFYLKAIVPKGIKMSHIYRSVIPYTLVELFGLALIMIFPQIALYLPDLLFK